MKTALRKYKLVMTVLCVGYDEKSWGKKRRLSWPFVHPVPQSTDRVQGGNSR